MIAPISNNSHNKPKFTGKITNSANNALDKLTDKMAYGIGKLASKKPAEKIVQGLGHFKKPSPRMGDLASIIYTVKLMSDTATSKKIENERKPALVANAALVTILSSTTAFIIDSLTDPLTKNANKLYSEKIKDGVEIVDKVKKFKHVKLDDGKLWLTGEDFSKGFGKMKSLTIFTLMVRILIPVLTVPITGAVVKKFSALIEKKKQEKAQKEDNAPKLENKQMNNADKTNKVDTKA